MKHYQETLIKEQTNLPIYGEFDVLVCGGGPAGVAAAETAAQRGNNTLLVEKNGFLGGAAVAGYSGTIGGLFSSSDNPKITGPQQIVFGWTDRFYKKMKDNQFVTDPQLYGKTFLVPFDPQGWKEVAEDMLLESGVQILYHSTIIGVIKRESKFKGIIVFTKQGLCQILAKKIIDATGDAELIAKSGLPYTMGDEGKIQNPTMIFRLSSVDIDSFKAFWGEDTICSDDVTEMIIQARKKDSLNLPRSKVWVYPTNRPNELFMNVTLITGENGRPLNVCDPDDHTLAEQNARKQVRDYAEFFRKYIPGCEKSFVNDLSNEVGVRQTRSIVGIKRLENSHITKAKKFSDGIVKSAWPIELHNGESPYMYWLIDDYYEVPFGTLVPKKGENIIVAGRNLCAEHEALASCRVIAQCFEYGHAAAIATDIALKNNKKYRELNGQDIRKMLNKENARLD
ncbi:FAD-dependent oxidoreductase [Enterococcus hulanensis]|uniref:FAD-dependent oxidoreductase n=1 Tax=Enterococcus hulanensis TaxID=2559929 RepID=UPI001A8F9C5E|nr:FAD-dependent oxidoreductase [Enterococcus hulanensis]MBO0456005.1 FAD-dependent oxidoreductase [Enterococcus hulanensis]